MHILIFIENYYACPKQKCILLPNRSYRDKVISVLLKVVKTQIVLCLYNFVLGLFLDEIECQKCVCLLYKPSNLHSKGNQSRSFSAMKMI